MLSWFQEESSSRDSRVAVMTTEAVAATAEWTEAVVATAEWTEAVVATAEWLASPTNRGQSVICLTVEVVPFEQFES